jgi:hypothetical protein
LLAAGFDVGVASGFVAGAASAVAGFACWDEVACVIGSSGVVLDEVVCFGCWGCAAPVAEGGAGEDCGAGL